MHGIMKIKIIQWWLSIPPISTKRTATSHLNWTKHKEKTTTYDVGNPDPALGQVQKCGGGKPVNGIQPSPLDKYWLLSDESKNKSKK